MLIQAIFKDCQCLRLQHIQPIKHSLLTRYISDDLVLVNLESNALRSLDLITSCLRLQFLNISHNEISDISAVSQMTQMNEFFARGNRITSL